MQHHSAQNRTATELPAGRVMVVGGGNTGFQIAEELAGSRDVHLAVGSLRSRSRDGPVGRIIEARITGGGVTSLPAPRGAVESVDAELDTDQLDERGPTACSAPAAGV